jgi:predicted dehydrogenase
LLAEQLREGDVARGGGTVQFGILGAAGIAARALVAPAREVAQAEVVAIAARNQASADMFARQHGIPTAYESYAALLADPSVDAVYVPLPNALHGSWTLRALEAGKHVLCEKPFAANVSEAERVAAAAASAGLVVMEAMHYRYHPLVRRMTSVIADGVIGTPRHIQCWTSWPVPDISDIRYSFELGGGALMDGGCYAIDCMRLLGLSDPGVTGALADPVPGVPVDRAIAARLSSAAGLTGWFESSFTGSFPGAGDFRADVHVTGDEGHLWLRNYINAQDGTLQVYPEGSSWPGSSETPQGTTFTWQLRAFTAAVLEGEPFPTTAANSVGTMRVIDDVYRASGLPVREPSVS